ncbi:MAG: hypothetical protein ACP5UA_07870 [Candidatus Hydrogenedens sp.]
MAHIKLGIITGSGLDFTNILDVRYHEKSLFDVFPDINTQIAGHKYQIIDGFIGSIPTILCSGRIHAYEGYTFEKFKSFLSYFQEQGITHLVSINTVGGLNKDIPVGNFVLVEKLISIQYNSFPIPSILYPSWVFNFYEPKGTYIWVTGPCYETESELRLFTSLGGDIIGMSGGPELYWAIQLGIKTSMFSCVTNNCFASFPLTHEQVVANAQKACSHFEQIFRNILIKEFFNS